MLSDMEMAARYAVSSHSKAVFYSGDNGKNHARALAQREAIPLDRTFAGKKLDEIYERNRQRFGTLDGDRRSNREHLKFAEIG